jgi:glutamyl-tRNA synthetase
VAEYQHLGIVPSAMVNFLALLGWSPGDDTEVMDRDTLVTRFALDGLQK